VKPSLERQRWVGVLALLLALPLPVTGVSTWPFLIPYAVVAAVMAAARRPLRPAPAWLENLLAPAIVVAVVLAGGARFGILRPVSHLALLLAAVRLPTASRRGGTPLSSLMLVLVGVAGVASSTHPILVLYLLVVMALVITVVGRWSSLGAWEAGASAGPAGWPGVRVVATTVVLASLVAAPLFALFPRLRSPLASTPLGGRPVSGFRESVTLSNIGDIRQSRRVALRIGFPEARDPDPRWLRLTGATLNHYRRGTWVTGTRTEDGLEGAVTPAASGGAELRIAEISLEVPGERLFVPVGSARLSEWPDRVRVRPGPLGSWRISRSAPLPIRYQAEFNPEAVAQPLPTHSDLSLPENLERLEELAHSVTGEAHDDLMAATLLEYHLQDSYGYTTALTLDSPFGMDPVEWFLFEGRRGHCEFFASAMVLLLRTRGIPARLQVGYLGGEHDGGDGFLVRDANAHAWVVAFVDGVWRVFDPTPAVEQPGITQAEGLRGLWTGWMRVEQFWDRWILTFSLADQVGLIRWLAEKGPRLAGRAAIWVGAAVLLSALAAGIRKRAGRRRRRPRHAAEAVARELESVLEAARRSGVLPGPSLTPRQAADRLRACLPDEEEKISWLVTAHERRRYAAAGPPPASRLRAVAKALRIRLKEAGVEPDRRTAPKSPG